MTTEDNKYEVQFYIVGSPAFFQEHRNTEGCIFAGLSKKMPHWLRKELGFNKGFGTWEQYITVYKNENTLSESKTTE